LAVLLRELAAEADLSGERVTVQVPFATVVPAGRRALKRILSNLLQNALRYSEGKPVELVGEPRDGETLIRVLDRGPGIEPARIEALFRPFQRLEIQRSPTTTGGVGLGLAIARQLAEVNGWRIELLPRLAGGLEARVILRGG
jgi:two-component system osmolarity sensor histidine kinase EnvZ